MTLQTSDCETDAADAVEAAPARAPWAAPRPPAFTAAEERVLALAGRDTLASLNPPGALDRLAALLFGTRPAMRPLADPRLEALRRAAIVARHRRHLPDGEAARLRAQGFDERQVRAVEMRAAR